MVGFFQFNSSPQPPGYITYLLSALQALKRGKRMDEWMEDQFSLQVYLDQIRETVSEKVVFRDICSFEF